MQGVILNVGETQSLILGDKQRKPVVGDLKK